MDTTSIKQVWVAMAGQRVPLVEAFYSRLFERHPQYRKLFPQTLAPQTEKMVEMFSSVAGFADQTDLVRPYLLRVGQAHRRLGITVADVENFKESFLETLAEMYPGSWEPRHESAWRKAFDEVILPLFNQGLEESPPEDG